MAISESSTISGRANSPAMSEEAVKAFISRTSRTASERCTLGRRRTMYRLMTTKYTTATAYSIATNVRRSAGTSPPCASSQADAPT